MSGLRNEAAGCSAVEVGVSIDGAEILVGATLDAAPGEVVGLLGPNGSGKSTLLRTVYRSLRPTTGAVLVADDDVFSMSAKESARRTGVVAQEQASDFDFTVLDVVEMGRSPHKRLFERDGAEDRRIIDEALGRVRMSGFEERIFGTLSGGEKQRVLVARSLAQRTRLLVLDEPTNHLDVRAQFELMDLVKGLGVTVIAALHDLNLAARYCDRVYVLQGGRIVAEGRTEDVLTADLLGAVFGVVARCGHDARSGSFHVVLLGAQTAQGEPASQGGVACCA